MDCKTARLLLELDRPHAPELDAVESAGLERHLSQCPTCREESQAERRFDEAVSQAMCAVEVPERLRSHLLSRLDADRSDWYRQWYGRGMRVAAVAAALLLTLWGVFHWREEHRQGIDVGQVWEQANRFSYAPPSPEQVEDHFRALGHEVVAPRDLKYAFLADMYLTDLQGQKVPQLLFLRSDPDLDIHEHARVYILSGKSFDLASLPRDYPSPSGYRYQVEVRFRPGEACAYLIVYTGESLSWLEQTPASRGS